MNNYRSRKCETCGRIFDFEVKQGAGKIWKCPECRKPKAEEVANPARGTNRTALARVLGDSRGKWR